jgi:murein DD-endopeptidase MepM/ murein hydrolase activator NlpD
MIGSKIRAAALCSVALLASSVAGLASPEQSSVLRGYDITKTGLTPRYPSNRSCSPLTSFFASWDDVDGTKREEPHSGVDGGRLGDPVLSPGPGRVVAAWKANWGWGEEGAILVQHSREELNLDSGPRLYYSEFDHLLLKEATLLPEGAAIGRGEKLASVFRPGGQSRYMPEVHWEVWELEDASATEWKLNKFHDKFWVNKTAHLIDPLYMLSLEKPLRKDGNVKIHPYSDTIDYGQFRGFTYILPCPVAREKTGK